MTFQVYRPHPRLQPYVECFWLVQQHVGYTREKILPTTTLELIVNLCDDPFRLYRDEDLAAFDLHQESWLVGLQTRYLINEPLGYSHMIGVRFRPGGAYPFFRVPASALHNQVLPLEDLWGGFARRARRGLIEAPDPRARFRLLERLLLARLPERGPEPPGAAVRLAVHEIARQRGSLSIAGLSELTGYSAKHLAERFKETVGVTPKTLARLYRFQAALQAVGARPEIDWAAIAYAARYYDQAHFNRDFSAFTGLTPGEYRRQRAAVFGPDLQPGEGTNFVPFV